MKRVVIVAAVAVALLAGAWWWGGPGARRRALARYPRVVLVTLDTLHLLSTGLFNPEVEATPNLDRFAANGVLFAQTRTTVPMTLPSHASLLSGRTPVGMGLLRNGDKVSPGILTLPQVLGEAGYRTAAFVSLATLRREYQLDRGFELYEDGYVAVPRFYRTADEVLASALPWIEAHRDEPYFVWVHFSDPHEPYGLKGAPPDVVVELDGEEVGRYNLTSKERHELDLDLAPGRHRLRWRSLREPAPDDLDGTGLFVRFRDNDTLLDYVASWEQLPRPEAALDEPLEIDLVRTADLPAVVTVRFDGGLRKPPPSVVRLNYALEVAYMDDHLGRLRSAVEQDGRPTLWIIASDHGEGLYRNHSVVGHAGFNREDQLRILWTMAGPGVPAGERIEAPALINDIVPTTLDLLGLGALPEADGQSMVDCLQGGDCPPRGPWFAHGFSQRHDKLSAVAAYRWPFKALSQDAPGSGSPEKDADVKFAARRLQRDIQEVRELLERQFAEGQKDLSDEDLDLLRSLGYLGN